VAKRSGMDSSPAIGNTPGRRCKSRHRKCWIIGPGWLWCYECGAIRLNVGPGEDRWTYPVGPDGENPAVRETRKR
jgi:hypothetical protein